MLRKAALAALSLTLLLAISLTLLLAISPADAAWLTVAGEHLQLSIDPRVDGPSGRLVVLPSGTASVTVESATQGGDPLSLDRVRIGRVMIQRGVPVVPVSVESGSDQSVDLMLAARDVDGRILTGEVSGDARGALTGETRGDWRELLAGQARGDLHRLGSERTRSVEASDLNRGAYLVIAYDDFAAATQPLIDWKIACGYDVSLHLTSETGTTLGSVRSFIQNAYDTWPNPPLYVLLVGDVEFVPCGDFLGNVSDHFYACVDGDDFLADLFVGRICAKTVEEVGVQVAKIVGYESRPDMSGIEPGDTDGWFVRAMMVAGNHGSTTPVPTCQWLAAALDSAGFTHVDEIYYPGVNDGCSPLYGCPIGDGVNSGVSIVNYRGWARESPPGWDVPEYTTEDIVNLQNGWKLPFVLSIVCNTGDYGRPDMDSFAEVWVKAGTAENPLGAVGFIGTGEHWSVTRWNDRLDIGIFQSILEDGVAEVGPVLASSKANLIEYFPTEVYLEDVTGEEAVEFYHYIYNILGDPSLPLWTAIPVTISAPSLPRSLGFGANYVDFQVVTADDMSPVAGAHVTAVQNGERIGYGVTDDSGRVAMPLAIASLDPIACTVTGRNLLPLQATINVNEETQSVTCVGAEVSGGMLVPGAALDITVTLANTGTESLPAGTAVLTPIDGVEITVGSTSFGSIAAGAETEIQTPFTVRIDPDIENGRMLHFLVTPSTGREELRATGFTLSVAAPEFLCLSASDPGDGVFSPGETCDLVLQLKNDGAIAAGALEAELALLAPGATVLEANATFAEIAPGAVGANGSAPFRIAIDPHLANGANIPFVATIHSSTGPECLVAGNLRIGTVDIGAPLGPDAAGYYCYDSADIDYPGQAPAYRWVEISPLYGGPGTRLNILINDRVPQKIALPFRFQYYGATYDSMLVSDNGWASFETTYYYDERNWAMPDRWGNGCQLAVFWDNLNPQFTGTDGIYTWHDEPNHLFVIEWNRLRHLADTANHWQTFQILLYDPAYHPTASGNGEIVFQYKHVYDEDRDFMYSTVGIEDATEEIGVQYCYANTYPAAAAPLSAGLAIKFTTEPPVYEPLSLNRFAADFAENSDGVRLQWELSREWPLAGFELWRVSADRVASNSLDERVDAALIPASARAFTDVAANPAEPARYELRAVGPFGLVRTLGQVAYTPFASDGPALRLAGRSPSSGETMILYQGRNNQPVGLAVYDGAGRRVRTLLSVDAASADRGQIVWDGRDERGQRVTSGLYWVRLRSGEEKRAARVVVVR